MVKTKSRRLSYREMVAINEFIEFVKKRLGRSNSLALRLLFTEYLWFERAGGKNDGKL